MTQAVLTQTHRCPRLSAGLVGDAALVLADLDGCLVSEGQAYPDAAGFVGACADRLWIVSNNSTHTASALGAELAAQGIFLPAGRILLAGEQTLRHLHATRPDARIALYATGGLQAEARALGLRLDDAAPDIALLCRDPGFTLRDLERLAAQLRAGARLWVANTDRVHPALDGRPIPETGVLLAAVQAILGEVAFECLGKPHLHMAEIALQASGVAPHRALFVGDNADTDGAMARAAGMPFAHLLREAAA